MIKQTKTNNLDYLINLAFNKVNRLFVLWFKNEDDGMPFSNYYTQSVKIKNFNVLIDGKFVLCVNKNQRRNIRKAYWNE